MKRQRLTPRRWFGQARDHARRRSSERYDDQHPIIGLGAKDHTSAHYWRLVVRLLSSRTVRRL